MRKKSSESEFKHHRRAFLLSKYRESLGRQKVMRADVARLHAVRQPAPRFWVSDTRAALVISKMEQGEDPTANMFPEKREMYREIFRRYRLRRQQEPHTPMIHILFDIVNSPAPRSYLSPYSLINIL